MIQSQLADSKVGIAAAKSLWLEAARETGQGLDPREKVSMVKVCSSETLGRVADCGPGLRRSRLLQGASDRAHLPGLPGRAHLRRDIGNP